jgi:hypothetical protein
MMATFSMVLDHVDAPPIPPWYFARDDRVYKAFTERFLNPNFLAVLLLTLMVGWTNISEISSEPVQSR